ncbi:MAG: DUF4399 domain-containing protein [Gemmatimonadota bacterium]|jgi:hypothetical protein
MLRRFEDLRFPTFVPGRLVVPMLLFGAVACGAAGTADAEREAAERVATVRIVEPVDGAELSGEVRVVLAAENIEIVPAGDTRPNSGHHHLFLNRETTPLGEAIPVGEPDIVHLGQAQTEYVFRDLAPGEYTLVAVIGDFAHRVIPQVADTVRFRVVAAQP